MDTNVKSKCLIYNLGKSNTGKSTVIRKLIELISDSNSISFEEYETIDDGSTGKYTDRYVVFTLNECKIAIITQGDYPNSVLVEKLIVSIKAQADIIICAANNESQIRLDEAVQYKTKKITHTVLDDSSKQDQKNIDSAAVEYAREVSEFIKSHYGIDIIQW